MATRYSDIYVGNENYEEFYINGSQIKEAWLNGECIWSLGSSVSSIIWLARYNGIFYLMYYDGKEYRLGKGEELGTIDKDIAIPSSHGSALPFFCDECIVLLAQNARLLSDYVKWVDYDLAAFNPSSTLHLNKAYCVSGCVVGNRYVCLAPPTSNISIIDFVQGRTVKSIAFDNYIYHTITTDGTNLVFGSSSSVSVNEICYKKLNIFDASLGDAENEYINIFNLHAETFTDILKQITEEGIDHSTIECMSVSRSPLSSSDSFKKIPCCVGDRIVWNVGLSLSGSGYSYAEQKTVEFTRSCVAQFVLTNHGAISSIEIANNYPYQSSATNIGKCVLLADMDANTPSKLWYNNHVIDGFSGFTLATVDDGYNYIAYPQDGILTKNNYIKEEIHFSYKGE